MEKIIGLLEKIADKKFIASEIKSAIWDFATEEGRGNVLWPMRYSLTGKDKSPDPFTVADILGKKESIKRLKKASEMLQ